MKAKPVIPRALASHDVDDAISDYLSDDADQAALGFIDALEKAYAHIGRHPSSGSTRMPMSSTNRGCTVGRSSVTRTESSI
jgi:toxin ParE1/3/4